MQPRQKQSQEPGNRGDRKNIIGGPGSSVFKGQVPSGSPPTHSTPRLDEAWVSVLSPNFLLAVV